MLDNELVDMVKQIQLVRSESNKIEIKAANKGCPKVRDSLSSFSNQSGGGVIIFGVDENDGYNVCGVYDAADLMKKVEAQCQEMTPVKGRCFPLHLSTAKLSYPPRYRR